MEYPDNGFTSPPPLRFIQRGGERILQYYDITNEITDYALNEWRDVPIIIEEQEKIDTDVNVDIIPTRRCPKCWTYGHQHRKDCPYADKGMEHHVPI